ALAEARRLAPQLFIVVAPIIADSIDIGELPGIPGLVVARRFRSRVAIAGIFADAQIGLARVPGHPQSNSFSLARRELERDGQRSPGAGAAFGYGCAVHTSRFRDILPGNR